MLEETVVAERKKPPAGPAHHGVPAGGCEHAERAALAVSSRDSLQQPVCANNVWVTVDLTKRRVRGAPAGELGQEAAYKPWSNVASTTPPHAVHEVGPE